MWSLALSYFNRHELKKPEPLWRTISSLQVFVSDKPNGLYCCRPSVLHFGAELYFNKLSIVDGCVSLTHKLQNNVATSIAVWLWVENIVVFPYKAVGSVTVYEVGRNPIYV